jgi:4'-phosphopantetheinyl transferase
MPTLLPEVPGHSLANTRRGSPEAREVHLWWVDLGVNVGIVAHLRPTLGPEELAVAGGFHRSHDRDRYIVAHAALRMILGGYLGRPPAALEFRHGPRGKPKLREGEVQFSMSRSHDRALCAVGGVEVGVDVERVHGTAELEWLSPLCSKAWRALAALPEADRPAAFYRAWTRMEACVKAAGMTVDLGLARLETFLDRDESGAPPRSYELPKGTQWRCHDLTSSAAYVAALAVSEETITRSTWWAGPEDERLGVPGSARATDSRYPARPGGAVQ